MSGDWWQGFFIGLFLPVIGLIITLWKFFLERSDKEQERREKLAERVAKEKAEERALAAQAALAAAESRADAPFFVPSAARVNLYASGTGTAAWHVMNGNVLCPDRLAVHPGTPAGTLVVLPLANMGDTPRWVGFKLNGVKINSVRYTDGTPELWGIIEYPFDPAANGQGQIVEVHFESSKGVQRVHRYGMRHGVSKFGRLDPQPSTDNW